MYIQTRKPAKTNSGTQHKSDFPSHSVPMGLTFQLQPVVQRRLVVEGKAYEDESDLAKWADELYPEISPHFQWKKKEREKIDLKKEIRDMLFKHISASIDFEFDNNKDLGRQLVQDIKLRLFGLHGVIGIKHQDGQFSKEEKPDDSETGRLGRSKPLRIYRTMPAANWDGKLESVLNGHGGSLGQALHYFEKSVDNFKPEEKTSNYDNILIEIKFKEKAQDIIDYTQITGGGEGAGATQGEKFTGKSEQNDLFKRDKDIFSINLRKSKKLIMKLEPEVNVIDRVSNYRKTT